jgi:hypothetical protein
MSIPASGTVIVNASGYFLLDGLFYDAVICSITNSTGVTGNHYFRADDHGTTLGRPWIPFASTRGFSVAAGTFTVRLVCSEEDGAVVVNNTNLTAIFVAQ